MSVVHALNSVLGVDVLDQSDLVAGCATLARDDGAVCKEVLPNLDIVSKTLKMVDILPTLNHLSPYLAVTLDLLPIQFLYQRQSVAE